MKETGWLSEERQKLRVEDLKPFLKDHKQKVTGKREELIQTLQDLYTQQGNASDFWKKKQ